MDSWEQLADVYESLQVKEDSLDTLIEYPAQRRAMGDFRGKRILDVACGSGRKALDWALNGAREVWGFDNNPEFAKHWHGLRERVDNLRLFVGDISHIDTIDCLNGERFDLITCLQALMYSQNIPQTIADMRSRLLPNGRLIVSVPHPFRFLSTKYRQDVPAGEFYRSESPVTFPSQWDESTELSHAKPTVSTWLNAFLESGFRVIKVLEPDLTTEQKQRYPHKARWMEEHFGCMIFVMQI